MATKYFVEVVEAYWSEWECFDSKEEALMAFEGELVNHTDCKIRLKEVTVNNYFTEWRNNEQDNNLGYDDVIEGEFILYEVPSLPMDYKGWWVFLPINLMDGGYGSEEYAHYIHDPSDWFDCCVNGMIEGYKIEVTYHGKGYLPSKYVRICDEDLEELPDNVKALYLEENWLKYSLDEWEEKKRQETGKFCVLSCGAGGWYCHGESPTLLGAKRLATKSQYYENFDWCTPYVFRMEDTREVENFYGVNRAPKMYSQVPFWFRTVKGWHESIYG